VLTPGKLVTSGLPPMMVSVQQGLDRAVAEQGADAATMGVP
jgi:hypothetical protein